MITAGQIAQLVGGNIEGDPSIVITGPSKIEEGGQGTISFFANPKYEQYVYTSTASVILIDRNYQLKSPVKATLIRVDNVYETIAFLLQTFQQKEVAEWEIDQQAKVSSEAQVSKNVRIGAFSIVESGATIHDEVILHGQVYIGKNATIGKGTVLHPGVKVYHNCQIGENCIIHSNVVIGADGFGFAKDKDGKFSKIPHTGNVIIGNQVEIGGCTVIDRATMGSTQIGNGVKIDNLCQIAHNVIIGDGTAVAGQSGIAGSTKIGKNCLIGGQVGFNGHITVADGTMVQAGSKISHSITEENTKWYGYPAIDYYNYLRAYAEFKQLPDLAKKIKQIEKQLAANKS